MGRQWSVLLALSVVLAASLAFAASPTATASTGYTYDANLCSDFGDGDVGACLDPGSLLGQQNPELILPVAEGIRVQATVLDQAGNGVSGANVQAYLETSDAAGYVDLNEVSPGVHQSPRVPYAGGSVYLVVEIDADLNGEFEFRYTTTYDPFPLA